MATITTNLVSKTATVSNATLRTAADRIGSVVVDRGTPQAGYPLLGQHFLPRLSPSGESAFGASAGRAMRPAEMPRFFESFAWRGRDCQSPSPENDAKNQNSRRSGKRLLGAFAAVGN